MIAALAALPLVALSPQGQDPVPPIQADGEYLVINFAEDDEEAIDLAQFAKLVSDTMGRQFVITDDTQTQLIGEKVRMFGTKRIPRDDFYRFFQIMMFIYDFACVEVGPPHMSVTVIQALQGPGRQGVQNIKQKAEYVLPEELDKFIDQPATLITTVITLPNTDVRQLTTSLRGLITDNQTQNMLNAGNSNAVVLTGFGSNIAALAKLLYIIDEASIIEEADPPLFRIIPLEFAGADEVADLIDQLLEAMNQNQRNTPRGGQDGQPGQPRGATEAMILTNPRNNSLIVMAMEEDMPRIMDLVAQLDVDVIEPERNFHIYNLENVPADTLADTLDTFLQDAERVSSAANSTVGRTQGQTGSSSSDRNEVVVVPDLNTNSLLIAASKTRVQEVLEMIRQLDKRQPQVLIETALIELNGTDSFNLGVELFGANIPGLDSTGGVLGTSFGLSDIDLTGQSDIFNTPNVSSGINAGIYHTDANGDSWFPVILQAAKSNSNTNVLNVPSVLVNNNGSAVVEVITEEPTAEVSQNQTGQQSGFGGYQSAGITMEISPSISASRYLRLSVTLSVSTFGASDDPTLPPPRVERRIQTTVNVPDGDTMVIGGIITDDKRESDTGVPFFSDLPLLGSLFSSESETQSKTTLYFFVTPRILRDIHFADLGQLSYEKKLQASEIIGLDRIQVIDPNFSIDQAIDLDAFEIPLYKGPERGLVDSDTVGLDPARRAEMLESLEPEPAETDSPVSSETEAIPEDVQEALEALGYIGEEDLGADGSSDDTED